MAGDLNLAATAGGPRTPDLRAALRRQILVIIACGLIGGLAGLGYASSREASFESKSTLQLFATATESAPGGGLGRTLDVETQATVARSTSLLAAVGERLGMSAAQARKASRGEAAPTGDILYLFFNSPNAQAAAEGATVYSEEFLAQRRSVVEQAVESQKDLLKTKIDSLTTEIADLTLQINNIGDTGSDPELFVLQQSQSLAIKDLGDARDALANIGTAESSGRVIVDPRTAVSRTGLQVSITTLGGALVGLLIGLVLALFRDRNDDRYGSAVGLESMGIHESGRVRYVANPRAPVGRNEPLAFQAYSRLLTRLSFSDGLPSDAQRSVLLVPVESETLPPEASERVAETLALESSKLGIVLDVFSTSTAVPNGQSYWESVPAAIGELTRVNDLVLIPGQALDRTAAGLGMASVVKETLLLVSLRTPVAAVQQAIDDLRSVDAEDVSVVVLTHLPRRSRR